MARQHDVAENRLRPYSGSPLTSPLCGLINASKSNGLSRFLPLQQSTHPGGLKAKQRSGECLCIRRCRSAGLQGRGNSRSGQEPNGIIALQGLVCNRKPRHHLQEMYRIPDNLRLGFQLLLEVYAIPVGTKLSIAVAPVRLPSPI